MPNELITIRRRAGWSRDRAAVEARVSYALAKIYELNPAAVADPAKRAALDAVWARMRAAGEGQAA